VLGSFLRICISEQFDNFPCTGEDVQGQISDEFALMTALPASVFCEKLVPDLPFVFHGTILFRSAISTNLPPGSGVPSGNR
jgi:hypothetical protein